LSEQPGKPSEVKRESRELFEELYGDYKPLLEAFKTAFEKTLTGISDISKLTAKVYYLFYKYLWSVPSSTYDREKGAYHYPDISLFDHSRGVSAIATSLVTEYNLKQIKEGKESQLILLEGDISGIQKFLFGVRNVKGVAKRLRARSFFLALLPELIASYILEKLGYNPTVNTLYASAGKFQLLIGYEEGIEQRLKGLQKEIEEILIEEFGGRLGFVLAWEIFPLKGLENYQLIVKNLHIKLADEKRKKFKLNLLELEQLANKKLKELLRDGKETVLCPSCGWEIKDENDGKEYCQWCETFQQVGSFLPKVRYIAFTRSNKAAPLEWKAHFEVPKLGTIYLLSEENLNLLSSLPEKGTLITITGEKINLSQLQKELRIFKLNATGIEENPHLIGFKFICQTVPSLEGEGEQIKPLLENLEEKEEWREGDILPFTVLQELAIGDKKLGYFKADVDNLGLVFMAGIKNYTFSRIATLSRMLELFFSLYTDRLLRDLKGELLKSDYAGREESKYLQEVASPVYTVFSGGDDLFLIAPWNVAVKVATLIRSKFGKYTCQNPSFGMSAGLGFFKGNFPIRLAADITDGLESRAKQKLEESGKKDKIALLDSVLQWKQLEELQQKGLELLKELEKSNLSRSLLYRLYIRLKAIKETTAEGSNERKEQLYRFIPYFYYQLARNVKEERLQKELEQLFIDPSEEELVKLKEGLVFLAYLLMLSRNLKKTKEGEDA
jgi:CRISPR-associated protein Csm1